MHIVHACIHAYTHAYIHAHTHTRIHALTTYTHTCIHAYTHTRMHAYMHKRIHAYMHLRHVVCHIRSLRQCFALRSAHVCMYVCMYVCIYVFIYIYIYIYIYTGRIQMHELTHVWIFEYKDSHVNVCMHAHTYDMAYINTFLTVTAALVGPRIFSRTASRVCWCSSSHTPCRICSTQPPWAYSPGLPLDQ